MDDGRARQGGINVVSNSIGGEIIDTTNRNDKDCVVWSETLKAYIHEPRATVDHEDNPILRRYTESDWATLNPVLAAGEEGYEIDTRKRKVGDGVTAWNDLEYDVAGNGGISSIAPTWFLM
jgi:hypothetical protein